MRNVAGVKNDNTDTLSDCLIGEEGLRSPGREFAPNDAAIQYSTRTAEDTFGLSPYQQILLDNYFRVS